MSVWAVLVIAIPAQVYCRENSPPIDLQLRTPILSCRNPCFVTKYSYLVPQLSYRFFTTCSPISQQPSCCPQIFVFVLFELHLFVHINASQPVFAANVDEGPSCSSNCCYPALSDSTLSRHTSLRHPSIKLSATSRSVSRYSTCYPDGPPLVSYSAYMPSPTPLPSLNFSQDVFHQSFLLVLILPYFFPFPFGPHSAPEALMPGSYRVQPNYS